MSIDTHKALVRRWFGEIVNGQTDPATLLAALDATFAPEFVDHDGPDPQHGRAALQRALPLLLTACRRSAETGVGSFVRRRADT